MCQVGGAACTNERQGCVRWVEQYVLMEDRGVSGGWNSHLYQWLPSFEMIFSEVYSLD